MIVRVSIENLVLVEHAEFEPGPGLTAVTGETGAGKTLLATAIGLLFGGEAAGRHVGPHAEHAWVEGEFDVDDAFWQHPDVAALAELRPEPDAPLVLARRVGANGRSRAMAWGRTVSRSDLVAAGSLLLATAGQHAGRKLVSAAWQRELVDAAGDDAHRALVAEVGVAVARLDAAREAQRRVHEDAERVAARADQVLDDLSRIDAVSPSLEDEAELAAQRDRIRNSASLHEAMAAALGLVGSEERSVLDAVGRAASELQGASTWDAGLVPLADALFAAQDQLGEVASQLRWRVEELSDSPRAIEEVEERLGAYDELRRRFGGTTEAVLARWQSLAEEARMVTDIDGVRAEADAAVASALVAATDLAGQLTASRRGIAERIAADATELLRELGMAGSVFEVGVEESGSLAAHGADRVELRIAPAASMTPMPVSKVASGGELSRIALALHVATGQGEAPTMVFDEIDAGIGGHTAHAIAATLKRLAAHAQVICITHLPQVAARADHHLVIAKGEGTTTLHALRGEDAVLDELCRMMGADAADEAARTHARQLRGPRFLDVDVTTASDELRLAVDD